MLIVQKYGGTSVGNPDRIKNVAARVAKYRAKGDQVVVVVSAMSGVTDNLIKLAKEIMPLPNEREMDVLLATGEQTTIALTAIALHSLGIPAVSLTGAAWLTSSWEICAKAWVMAAFGASWVIKISGTLLPSWPSG
jgi:aspartate kinase